MIVEGGLKLVSDAITEREAAHKGPGILTVEAKAIVATRFADIERRRL